ncbi:hypothetical protein F5141DRAFT_1112034 [Pisolithus sp. B1]|nr:hypothetical protein F5141DRAFT_1112034 [Pisolithus sp. B1]
MLHDNTDSANVEANSLAPHSSLATVTIERRADSNVRALHILFTDRYPLSLRPSDASVVHPSAEILVLRPSPLWKDKRSVIERWNGTLATAEKIGHLIDSTTTVHICTLDVRNIEQDMKQSLVVDDTIVTWFAQGLACTQVQCKIPLTGEASGPRFQSHFQREPTGHRSRHQHIPLVGKILQSEDIASGGRPTRGCVRRSTYHQFNKNIRE